VIFIKIWVSLGLIGLILFYYDKNMRPEGIVKTLFCIFTHVFFGPMGLLHGYIPFAAKIKRRKNQ
jgi:hypothetical protein